jgi:hypothetical protein
MSQFTHSAFSVQVDPAKRAELERVLANLHSSVGAILARAVNRTTTNTQADVSKTVRSLLELKATSIKRRVRVTDKATAGNPRAVVNIDKKHNPALISFGRPVDTRKSTFDPTGQGVRVSVRKGGSRERWKHAFIARTPFNLRDGGANYQVLRRKVVGGKPVGRYPLVNLTGPSVLAVLQDRPGVLDSLLARANRNLQKNIDSQVQFELSKIGKKP